MRFRIPSLALFATLTALVPSALAQPAEAAPDPSERTHDGLYVRLSLGGGYLKAKFRDGDETPNADARGGAAMVDIMVGGTPLPGLVVGGGYQVEVASEADHEIGQNYTGSSAVLSKLMLGPFVEWFPDRHGGLSLGLCAGYTMLNLETPRIFGFGEEIDSTGVGGNVWLGFAPFIAAQWSLGGVVRAGLARTKNNDDSSQTGSAWNVGLLASGVYH